MLDLNFSAPLRIEASATDKPAKVSALCYSGGKMTVPGWGVVAIDLSNLELPAQVPLLVDHESKLAGVVGSGVPTVRDGRLYIDGTLSRASESAGKVISMAADGFPWQASVGVEPIEQYSLRDGESRTINSQTVTGPARVITSGRLREVSITSIGCDPQTAVRIAAARRSNSSLQGVSFMDFEAYVHAAGFDAANLTDTQRTALEAAYKAETDAPRLAAVRDVCAGKHDAVEAAAIRNGWDADRTRLEIVRASHSPIETITTSRAGHQYNNADIRCAAMMMHLGGHDAVEKCFGEQTLQAAADLKATSLVDVIRATWPTSAGPMPRGTQELLRASFSQVIIPDLLSNSANKLLEIEWDRVPLLSRLLSKKVSAANFKEHKVVKLTATDSAFEELSETGEIRHGSLGDDSTGVTVKTYAKMLSLTREDIVNDDLSALASLPEVLVNGGATTMEKAFWTLVLGGIDTGFYSAGRGNLIDDPFSSTGLSAAVTAMRSMVDAQGEPVMITPRYLVTTPTNESVADALFTSLQIVATGATDATIPADNSLRRKYQPLVSPHVALTALGGSAATWFLFSQPGAGGAGYIISYLNGIERPTIEADAHDFNRMGMRIRGWIDFGMAEHDHRCVIRSSGDAT